MKKKFVNNFEKEKNCENIMDKSQPSTTGTQCRQLLTSNELKRAVFRVRREAKRVVLRGKQMRITRNVRLIQLARPRFPRKIHRKPIGGFMRGPEVEVVHKEVPVRTRTEQLAYPQARKLIVFKKQVRKLFSTERLLSLNRRIRLSLLTVYSRLQNVQPPRLSIHVQKWDEKEWKRHTRYLKKLARPKKPPPMPKLPKAEMPYEKLIRYKKLAQPIDREAPTKEAWVLTPQIKLYKASKRVLELARPKLLDDQHYQPLPWKVTPNALKYKASKRIVQLATPQEVHAHESEFKENPFSISPNALKAKPSARTEELAEPKEFENVHIRANPNAISPAALKAKASPRIVELAKPRGT